MHRVGKRIALTDVWAVAILKRMAAPIPIFLSVVLVVRNRGDQLTSIIERATGLLKDLVTDYELIIVDNGSDDDSLALLQQQTGINGFPNLQIYALTKEVDTDTAFWAGLENSLGDFVAVIDPLVDDIAFLPDMLEKAVTGADVVFARNRIEPSRGYFYRLTQAGFNLLYKWLTGIHLDKEAPRYRLLARRVINFVLQHPQPALTYRHLPATAGFSRVLLEYRWSPASTDRRPLTDSIDHGIRLLVSTTRAPMRLVTGLSLFGAVANLIYSLYVVAIAIFKEDVAPGWVSMSLQQSGMFFLLSLVLLVLGEYIIQMAAMSGGGPLYHIASEFTSARMERREKLNIEESRHDGHN